MRALVLLIVLVALPVQSFARDYQLNIPEKSKSIRDIAPINGDQRDLPYETQEKDGISISYNILAGYVGNTYGYSLRLIFINTGTSQITISPKVALYDGDGFVVSSNVSSIVDRANERKGTVQINVNVPGQPWYAGRNMRKEREAANDDVMLSWMQSFWLAKSYDIPAGTAASGAVFYPIPDVGALPLRLQVEINGTKFEFLTNTK